MSERTETNQSLREAWPLMITVSLALAVVILQVLVALRVLEIPIDLLSWAGVAVIGILVVQLLYFQRFVRRQRQEQRRSQEKYRQLFEDNPAGVYRTTEDGKLLDCNQSLVEMFGFANRTEMLEVNVRDLYVNISDRELLIGRLVHNETQTAEVQLKKKDGASFYGLLKASRLANTGGETQLEGTIFDITERKWAEKALQGLSEIVVDQEVPFSEKLQRLFALGCSSFDVDMAELVAVRGSTLKVIEARAPESVLARGRQFDLKNSYTQQTLLAAEPQHFHNAEGGWLNKNVANVSNIAEPFPLESYIGLPVQVMGRYYALEFFSQHPRSRPFRQAEIELLRLMALWVEGEMQRKERDDELHRLSTLMKFLQTCSSIKEACAEIAEEGPDLFPDASGAIYLLNAATGQLKTEARWKWGENADSLKESFQREDCLALRFHKEYGLADATRPCRHVDNLAPSSYLCLPIRAGNVPKGVFHLRFEPFIELRSGTGSAMNESRRRLAVAVAEHFAMALANLDLSESLRDQAERDPLTGLFNRRYLEHWLEREPFQEDLGQTGVIMLDVDNFKAFNKEFAHEAGDVVLGALGNLIRREIRDRPDIACRYGEGADEFVLILPGASLEPTLRRAERLRQAFSELSLFFQGKSLGTVTMSLGVAAIPIHGLTLKDALDAADNALRRAKKNNSGRKDCVHVAGEETEARADEPSIVQS